VDDYLRTIILGIVEGLTEFLPVSSTAHLRLAQDWMGIDLNDGFWKTYAIVIQLGAVLCLPVYFRGRIMGFIRTFPKGADGHHNVWTHPLSLVILAFVVTAIPCYLIDKEIGKNLESLPIIGRSLLIGGIVMWLVDLIFGEPRLGKGAPAASPPDQAPPAGRRRTLDMADMTWKQAMTIGAAQILAAAFPGTSRSMATIAAGQVVGMSRPAALEFSFFLSIPVMFAATLLKLVQPLLHSDVDGEYAQAMTAHQWLILAIGFAVSFIVALAVVHWFMGWVRRRGFAPFAIYRIAMGAAVLWWMVEA
jgi:undecaprenyl-diphosphatase